MTQFDPSRPLRIGTRGSALALAQAHEVRDRLMAAHGLPDSAFSVVVIKTTGDRIQDRPLRELGGKGLFTREIEAALATGEIDIAVHSMKDMPVLQPPGLIIDTILPREDPRDGFVSLIANGLADLPPGAVIGTSSLRRQAQIMLRRPDLRPVEFRGNVQTRLEKLRAGVADATFLAIAGLNRLGLVDLAQSPVSPDDMLPALAQGAIGVERRQDDEAIATLLAAIDCPASRARVVAERAFLAGLDGSCETPIAGLAELTGNATTGHLRLRGEVLRPDGSATLQGERSGPVADAHRLGADLAEELLAKAPAGFMDFRSA